MLRCLLQRVLKNLGKFFVNLPESRPHLWIKVLRDGPAVTLGDDAERGVMVERRAD